jgi:hypothetical protein
VAAYKDDIVEVEGEPDKNGYLKVSYRHRDDNERVRIQRSNVSIFLTKPRFDTIVTIFQNRADQSSWLALWKKSVDDMETLLPSCKLWEKLKADLRAEPPLRLREEATDFLLYEILDRIVEELRPIADAYAARLGFFRQQEMWQFTIEMLDEVDEVQLELVDMARSMKPLFHIVKQVIFDKKLADSARCYLEDVKDAIQQMEFDICHLQAMCKTLEEAHTGYQDRRMNGTLFVLSVISAVFLPAQFITGLYGMNFQYIPELEMDHGYLYFWILQGSVLAFITTLFLTHQLVPSFLRLHLRKCVCRKPRRHLRSGSRGVP